MNSRIRFFISLFACAVITACVPNQYQENIEPVSLLKQSRAHIKTASVVIGLDPNNSNNFIATHQAAANQQGGLIGYLVTSAIASSFNDDLQQRATLMSPIKNAAIEFNFGSQYRKKLKQGMNQVSWLDLKSITKTPNFQRYQAASLHHQYKEDAIIVSDVFYRMAEDFSKITFTSYVTIFPNNDALKSLARKHSPEREQPVLYQKMFSTDYRLQDTYNSPDQAAAIWANNNAAMVHKAMNKSIGRLSNLITQDLNL